MSTQLDRVEDLLRDHVERSQMFRATTEERLDKMSSELAQNTAVTTQVRDAARVATWIRKAVIWVGGLGGGLFGIYQLWSLFKGGGIGPAP